ncbi:MAG TPA: AbrB/MazE/SpoVT family DNA-binding domain-containing protein [Syntrophobacteria bacterium]|nr:AbrB/MazE/SpoVT family DNA-binding domain-containing protein [Syntrophobacteria bacterium]
MAVEVRSRDRSLDPKDIAKEILNGSSFDQIQQKYGIKMRSQLLALYTRGLALLNPVPVKEPSPPPAPKAAPARAAEAVKSRARRVIGTSGTITLTRALLIEELGFKEGDRFAVSRQGDRIILERVDS